MSRREVFAVAQLGPIHLADDKASAVARLVEMLREAHARGARWVTFPELALTTFFPRYIYDDPAEYDQFYEEGLPSPAMVPLFEEAKRLGVGFYLGYAEKVTEGGKTHRFNTAVLVSPNGDILGKYRKIHLPGTKDPIGDLEFEHLEKRYFEVGDLGFPTFATPSGRFGMCICNDRRWPETWRVLGLGGAELVVLGYNTPFHYPLAPEHDHLQYFHNELSVQAGCYQNGMWAVSVAKAGREEGCDLIGGSIVVGPTGEVIAKASTVEDEVITAIVDLDRCGEIRRNIFNFAQHREPGDYQAITRMKG